MNLRERLLQKTKGKPVPFDLDGDEILLKPLTVREFSDIMDKSTTYDAQGNAVNDVGMNNALCAIAMARDPETKERVLEDTDIDTLLSTEMNSPMWKLMLQCQRMTANVDEDGNLKDGVTDAKNSLNGTPTPEA